jgi:hypothetical protein
MTNVGMWEGDRTVKGFKVVELSGRVYVLDPIVIPSQRRPAPSTIPEEDSCNAYCPTRSVIAAVLKPNGSSEAIQIQSSASSHVLGRRKGCSAETGGTQDWQGVCVF